jgi:hypothetical protein
MSTTLNPAKTIAVWYESNQGGVQKSTIELHFNLWKLPNGNNYLRFLDIGIMIPHPAEVRQLCIYFPFEVSTDCFEDIVGKFITDSNLVSAIFNENYTVASEPSSKSRLIKKGDQEICDIYETGPQNVQRQSLFGGTVFKLNFQQRGRPVYLRFRVSGGYPASLSITQKAANAFVQSAFSQTEMIDFRVNEARDLNQDLREEMLRQASFTLAKVHFFFVCSYGEDIVGAHEQYAKCRNLENYRWKSYVGNDKLNHHIYLAYQWTKEKRDDFGVLIRTKFERNNRRVLATYLGVLLLITVLFSVISSYAFEFIPSSLKPHSQPCVSSSPSSPSLPQKFSTALRDTSLDGQSSKMPTSRASSSTPPRPPRRSSENLR